MAKGLEICAPASDPNLLGRVSEMWDFVAGFPVPKCDVKCEQCGSGDVQGRNYLYSEKDKGWPYRVDTDFKCRVCSKIVGPFGVAIGKEVCRRMCQGHKAFFYGWRDAQQTMRDALGR